MKFDIIDTIKDYYFKACSIKMSKELECQLKNLLLQSDIEELDGLRPHLPPYGNPYKNGIVTLSFNNRLEQGLKLDIHQEGDNSFNIRLYGEDRNPFSITLLNNGNEIIIIFSSDSDLINICMQKDKTTNKHSGRIKIYTNILLEKDIPGRDRGYYSSSYTPKDLSCDAIYNFSFEDSKTNDLKGSIIQKKSILLRNDDDESFDIIDIPKKTSIYNLLKYIGRLFQDAHKETINPKRISKQINTY